MLAGGKMPIWTARAATRRPDWPDDLAEIVYVDHYGNAMTSLRAGLVPKTTSLLAGGQAIPHARTFADMPGGAAFWYENSNGLAEIAVNLGSAAEALGLAIGSTIAVEG
jgi:S-adenosyl-L-methionine hydrolase (adenosine-forming)